MTDRLIDILKRVDAAERPSASESDALVEAVMSGATRRLRRRRATRVSVAGVTILALFIGAYGILGSPSVANKQLANTANSEKPAGAVAIDAAAVRAEIDRLDRQITLTTAVVDRVERDEQIRRARRRLTRVTRDVRSYDDDPSIAAESAAQTMLLHADRLAGDKHTRRLAPETYRRIIQLFPNSVAAEHARKRLGAESKGERA